MVCPLTNVCVKTYRSHACCESFSASEYVHASGRRVVVVTVLAGEGTSPPAITVGAVETTHSHFSPRDQISHRSSGFDDDSTTSSRATSAPTRDGPPVTCVAPPKSCTPPYRSSV